MKSELESAPIPPPMGMHPVNNPCAVEALIVMPNMSIRMLKSIVLK